MNAGFELIHVKNNDYVTAIYRLFLCARFGASVALAFSGHGLFSGAWQIGNTTLEPFQLYKLWNSMVSDRHNQLMIINDACYAAWWNAVLSIDKPAAKNIGIVSSCAVTQNAYTLPNGGGSLFTTALVASNGISVPQSVPVTPYQTPKCELTFEVNNEWEGLKLKPNVLRAVASFNPKSILECQVRFRAVPLCSSPAIGLHFLRLPTAEARGTRGRRRRNRPWTARTARSCCSRTTKSGRKCRFRKCWSIGRHNDERWWDIDLICVLHRRFFLRRCDWSIAHPQNDYDDTRYAPSMAFPRFIAPIDFRFLCCISSGLEPAGTEVPPPTRHSHGRTRTSKHSAPTRALELRI